MTPARFLCAATLSAILAMAAPAMAEPAPKPVVEGYLPSIRGMEATLAATNITPYTAVALSFINPDASGNIVAGDGMACMTDRMGVPIPVQTLRNAIDTLHHKGHKAIGALAGALLPICAGSWSDLTSTAKRASTVATLAAFAQAYNLDGLDVDIEGSLLAQMVRDGSYVPFVRDLSAALKAEHKTLSGTTAAYVGGMIPLAAIPAFDTVNLMSYDNNVPGEEEASLAKFKSDLYLWLGRGVAKSKLVMGVPFYGRGYGSYLPAYRYRDLAASFGPQAQSGDLIGQMCATCDYISFNSPALIREKTRLAKAHAGGVMVWELSEDTPDGVLLAAVKAGLGETTTSYPSAAAAPAPNMSARLGFESAKAWTVYGDGATGKLMPDAKVSGGQAMRVTLSHPTENTWDIGASTPVAEPLKANVTIGFAVWARLNTTDRDAQLDIPVAVQLAASPYTPIIQGHVTVTSSWQLLYITGTPSTEYPPGAANAALSLGSAAKVIDLGPAFMFRVN